MHSAPAPAAAAVTTEEPHAHVGPSGAYEPAPPSHPAAAAAAPVEAPSVAYGSSASPVEVARVEPAASAQRPDDLLGEVRLVESARAALAQDPALALRRTDEAASAFPNGQLGDDRVVIAIEALLRLGRRDEARARAQRVLLAGSRNAYASRLRALPAESE